MVPVVRNKYNSLFSEKKYQAFLYDLNNTYQHAVRFRVAETPVFIPKYLKSRLIEAGNDVIDLICRPDFRELTDKSIPKEVFVPNEVDRSLFVTVDLGICKDENIFSLFDSGALIYQFFGTFDHFDPLHSLTSSIEIFPK